MKKRLFGALSAIALSSLTIQACGTSDSQTEAGFVYTAVAADANVPASALTVQGWIDDQDDDSIRHHGWEIWAAITADSGETLNGRALPVFQTWFSGSEIFVEDAADADAARSAMTDFENPHGAFKDGRELSGPITSFNKFNFLYTEHVLSNEYNVADVLTDLNSFFDFDDTDVESRSINGFPNGTTALKPVFMLVKQAELTAIPYWEGPDNSTDPDTPSPETWDQCVAVDATEARAEGSEVTLACNGVDVTQTVHYLDDFYHFELTEEEVEQMSASAQDELAGAEAGDYAVLVAMHVTVKETPQWSWETFWWHPEPSESPAPAETATADDLALVSAPWNNYAMCTAFYMVTPPGVGDTPKVCYNPYLETGLEDIDGIQSNCMSCHAMATWGDGDPDAFGGGLDYVANGEVDQNDAEFDTVTKLDFLWSITRSADPTASLFSSSAKVHRKATKAEREAVKAHLESL